MKYLMAIVLALTAIAASGAQASAAEKKRLMWVTDIRELRNETQRLPTFHIINSLCRHGLAERSRTSALRLKAEGG